MRHNFFVVAVLGILFSCEKAPVDYVNPLIGTARENYGGLAPFVARPYGMTKFTPQTHDNAVCMGPYVYEDTVMIGFLASHQPLVECMGDYGSVSLMPQCGGEVRVKNADRGMRMDKASERSRAYGYSVTLMDDGDNTVDVSMSALSRAGIMSFSFPGDIAPRIIVQGLHLPAEFENFLNDIDARRAILEGWIRVDAEKGEIVGYNPDRQSHMWGPELEGFKGWFVIRFDRPIVSWGCWDNDNCYSGLEELKSKVRNGAWVDFAPGAGTVRAQIGTSFIGEKEARDAIEEELHGWNLRRLERDVRREWAAKLRKLGVEGVDDDQKAIFYTAVFHAYQLPRELGEDGRYYSAYDDEVHEGVSFTDFATWDTFRALHPLMTMLEPELTASWIRALIDIYEQGGWLPKWPNPSYSNVMIGTHADAIISDAYMKGIRDYDTDKAFEAMMKDASVPPDNDTLRRWIDRENTRDYEARGGLTYYLTKGYIPCDKTSESVSRCVEFGVDDWAIAQVARDMGKLGLYDTLISHSHNWKNHYQEEIGYLAPRLSDGNWLHADSASLMTYSGNMYFAHEGFTEANPRCYMFGAMHDVPAMIELFGKDHFIEKLDEAYDQHYYSHDNEPSHHYDYLYNFVGMPWKTQEKVRIDIENAYSNKPSGVVGNDDCGQMSAWYLLSSMGVYPMTPASNRLELGAPQLPKMKMKLRGHTLTMTAEGLSPVNKYVKEAFIDGRRITRPYITWDEFVSARSLRFVMTDTPCDSWACEKTSPAVTPSGNLPVDFSEVTIRDGFWKERLEKHASVTAPFCMRQCMDWTGRTSNFAIAAGLKEGTFIGLLYDDSDVYKTLEGVAYSLCRFPNPELESRADSLIGIISAAQQPDGYLNTYFTLVEPDRKWQVMDFHETYCAGHLIEAGIAYYHATGKKQLLETAMRFADHICDTFGENKRDWVPGHEEIELALIKLYRETGDKKYLETAHFFLEERGRGKGNWNQSHSDLDYHQDLVPVREMDRICGHAVRATYLLTAMADYCAASGDTTYLPALRRVWDDLIESKTYITGGIGASHGNEGFSDDFYLPNKDAYCETCSSVGFIFWDQRMSMLLGDGKYQDALETTLYNAALDGLSLSADRFFYVNPLASDGDHHRQVWYVTACCPSQISRFLPSVGGYLYATSDNTFWVHQYAASEVCTKLDGKPFRMEVETNYPWDGHIGIILHPEKKQRFCLKLRVPAWCGDWSVRVNGRTAPVTVRNGYASIDRRWKEGDKVELTLNMTVETVEADPRVLEDKGLRAVRRGPVVYCAEETDNPQCFGQISLSPATRFVPAKADGLLESIPALSASDGNRSCILIPYFAWDNREAGKMAVWFPWREDPGAN